MVVQIDIMKKTENDKKTKSQNYSKIKSSRFIKQSEGAKIAQVSRQAIGVIKDLGTYDFFSEDKKKIDSESKQWVAYLQDQANKGKKIDWPGVVNVDRPVKKKKSVPKKTKIKSTDSKKEKIVIKKTSKKKNSSKKSKRTVEKNPIIEVIEEIDNDLEDEYIDEDELLDNEPDRQKFALTGGVDPSTIIPTTTQQLKHMTEIQEKNINMQDKLNELVYADMLISIFEIVTKDIRNFVTLCRKVSDLICQKLECVGMEKTVENVINDEVEIIVKMMKKNMERSIDIKSYKR